MQANDWCSGHINATQMASDLPLMVFIAAMGPFTDIIKIIFIHDILQIVLGRNTGLWEATDLWAVNKHEKQSVFHL